MNATAPVVIVGAGPAGMGAAIELARSGVRCVVVDEQLQPGGQIYRVAPPGVGTRLLQRPDRGVALRAEARELADYIEVYPETSVLSIEPGFRLLCLRQGRVTTCSAPYLVLAPGAYDRPMPTPGWTLPGVLTAGGVQSFVKTMAVRPGKRALVTGTGPLLLVVANQLRAAGVDVVAVLEAGRPPWSASSILGVLSEPGLLKEAYRHLSELKRARIPLLFNHSVFRIHGDGAVAAADYGPLDPNDWSPNLTRSVKVEVDLVVLGYGFVPNTELSQLVGCEHFYAEELGGWMPVRNPDMSASIDGVYCVGDGAGVAGAIVAESEGRLAGIQLAEKLGALRVDAEARRRPHVKRLASLTRARAALDEMSRIRSGIAALMTADTLVCRCEEVSLGEVVDAVGDDQVGLSSLKLLTRVGMGACQGRNCAPTLSRWLSSRRSIAPGAIDRINARPPLRPVTLGQLADAAGNVCSLGGDS